MKKLSAVILGLCIALAAPFGGLMTETGNVYAQEYSQVAKDFSNGVQYYLNGIAYLSHWNAMQEDGSLGNTSHSYSNFGNSKDLFFRVVMADPNYNHGRALEMYVMSKLALDEDVTETVKEYLGRSDFKYRTKLKNFLIDILNDKHGEINFLWDDQPTIKEAVRFGRHVKVFDIVRSAELIQTLYEIDKSTLRRIKASEREIIKAGEAFMEDEKYKLAIDLLKSKENEFPKSYWMPYKIGYNYQKLGNNEEARKLYRIAKDRAPTERKKVFQFAIDKLDE